MSDEAPNKILYIGSWRMLETALYWVEKARCNWELKTTIGDMTTIARYSFTIQHVQIPHLCVTGFGGRELSAIRNASSEYNERVKKMKENTYVYTITT